MPANGRARLIRTDATSLPAGSIGARSSCRSDDRHLVAPIRGDAATDHPHAVASFPESRRWLEILFDGVPEPEGGVLRPDRSVPGLGLALKRAEAGKYAA